MNTYGQFLHESQVYNGNKVESLNVENTSLQEYQFFFIGTEHVTFWKCKKRKTKEVMKQFASRIQTYVVLPTRNGNVQKYVQWY